MVAPKAVLTIQRQVAPETLARALAGAGVTLLRTEDGCGDSGEGVSRYFNFAFTDPGAEHENRFAQGFVALSSDQHPDGWTRLRLGSDRRGREIVAILAETLGGGAYDEASCADIPLPGDSPGLRM